MADTISIKVLEGLTTGTSNWYACNDAETAGVDVVWGDTVSAGAVQLQFTNDPDNTNATYTEATVTYPDRNYGVPRLYKFFRAKISTNIVDDTLDAVYLNKVLTQHGG